MGLLSSLNLQLREKTNFELVLSREVAFYEEVKEAV